MWAALRKCTEMKALEDKIRKFAQDPAVIVEVVAMMKVGRDKDDSAEVIMSRVIAGLLFRFHGIPTRDGGQN